MKKSINILVALLASVALAVSCEKAPKIAEGIVSEWQLTEMTGFEASDLPKIYVDFKADMTFEIYQKVGDIPRYRKYEGTYVIEGSNVKGEYSDGEKWGCVYRASFEADGAVLVLTALETDKSGNVISEGEVCKYTKASLDQKEKDAADVVTKSVEETSRRFL